MEEKNVNIAEPMNGVKAGKGLPAKVSIWSRIKNFLCQDIVVELTPKQEKVLTFLKQSI